MAQSILGPNWCFCLCMTRGPGVVGGPGVVQAKRGKVGGPKGEICSVSPGSSRGIVAAVQGHGPPQIVGASLGSSCASPSGLHTGRRGVTKSRQLPPSLRINGSPGSSSSGPVVQWSCGPKCTFGLGEKQTQLTTRRSRGSGKFEDVRFFSVFNFGLLWAPHFLNVFTPQ